MTEETDTQQGRRAAPISLAAEIQRQLLPTAPSCEAAEFALACALVPANAIAGDSYDYVLDYDTTAAGPSPPASCCASPSTAAAPRSSTPATPGR
nr:hypothetical protein [Actinospica robiniae]